MRYDITLQRVFAGGIHSSAYASEPSLSNHPPQTIVVERWNEAEQRWSSIRQVWDATEQRYKAAA
jgi:hypothetical protein